MPKDYTVGRLNSVLGDSLNSLDDFFSKYNLPEQYIKNISRAWYDEKDGYTIKRDMPGFEKSEIQISMDDRKLYIKAESLTDESRKSINISYWLADEVDKNPENIKAKYKNGVLTIKLKQKTNEEPEPTRINIE